MSRELIVSVNGREKKIAIVENDRVTEFYIERGEQNQGIVGNIYKGRVMRVLPGMQSAFVDIGLERDAFLYVTDFFDEEAEFERIVVDKSKKVDTEAATRAATEHIEQARIDGEQHIEATHERVEPLLEVEPAIAEEKVEPTEEAEPRRRGRRGGRGRGRAAKTEEERPEERSLIPTEAEPIETPFVVRAQDLERGNDDEERAMNGEMFKDARLQERIMDEVHAVEFDLEDVPSAPVGSLLTGSTTEMSDFQRIADEEEAAPAPRAPTREIEAAHVRDFVDEVVDESSRGFSFQRVSDEEESQLRSEASSKPVPSATPTKKESLGSRRRKKAGVISRLFKAKKEEEALEAENEMTGPETSEEEVFPDSEASVTSGRSHEEFATRRGGRRRRRPKQSPAGVEGNEGKGDNDSGGDIETPGEPFEAQSPEMTDDPFEVEEIQVAVEEPEVTPQTNEIAKAAPRDGRRAPPSRGRRPARRERTQPAITDLLRTWQDVRKDAEKRKAPALVHRDLDLVQRILRDQLSEDFTAIRIDAEDEYQRIVEFVNRMQPRMVKRVKLYTRDEPILESFGVQVEIDKAIKPRVWLKSGGYLVINQTEALVSIDVNTGKFVGRGATRLEDTITRTNMEAVEEIARQIRLRDLGGIIVLDLIDMEERRNRQRVMTQLQDALRHDKSPTKVLSFNDFGLVIMTRKRVKQSLERTLCTPCLYCQGAGLVKSPQTICYEILEQARRLGREGESGKRQAMLRINPEVAKALRGPEREVLNEIEDYLGSVDINSDPRILQEQFDFAFV